MTLTKKKSGMTPAEFFAEVHRVINDREADIEVVHRVLVSLCEDTLREFGYEDGVDAINEWRKGYE